MNNYIVIDLETTGLNPKRDRIIEVGAIKIIDDEISDRFHTFVNPRMVVSDITTQITGITQDIVDNAPYFDDVYGQLMEFLEDYPLIGHNITFDYSFLKKESVNRKDKFAKKGIDTLKISRKHLGDLPSRKLDDLCVHYGIEDNNHHRADNDALVTWELFKRLKSDYYEHNKEDFEATELVYHIKKEGPITKPQFERLTRMLEAYGIELDRDIRSLTKNEASRLIDKIVLQYGRMK